MNAALQADLPDPSFEALQKLPADQRGLPDPAQGEGTDRPPTS